MGVSRWRVSRKGYRLFIMFRYKHRASVANDEVFVPIFRSHRLRTIFIDVLDTSKSVQDNELWVIYCFRLILSQTTSCPE